jgi:hypothetical protein
MTAATAAWSRRLISRIPVSRLAASLAATVIAAGCATAGGSLAPTTAPPSPASQPASPGPSTSSLPDVALSLVGDAPVIQGASLAGGGSYVLPGAVVFQDGTYHAFLVALGSTASQRRVLHATSPDGATWAIDTADPFAGLGLVLQPPGPIPTSVLVQADGSWVIYLWGTTDPTGVGSMIWRATAPAPTGPWRADPDPVLSGTAGAWDSLGVDFPGVIRAGDGYLMVYSGSSDRISSRIGLARSVDGIAWTKGPGPIISPGHCGTFDDLSVNQPRLAATPDGYLVAYGGSGQTSADTVVAASTSHDGVTWTCASTHPLLQRPDIPGSQGIHTIAVAGEGASRAVLIESLTGSGSDLWLAELSLGGS